MEKKDLLKHIAQTAYSIGFGAKLNFATYDIISKAPKFIGFLSIASGVYALVFEALDTKHVSATFIVLGIVGIYAAEYTSKKDQHEKTGRNLTDFFNQLKRLYSEVKTMEGSLDAPLQTLVEIENSYTKISRSNQILFSNWYAHYKFFWEHQIDWIDEQLEFSLFRDKLPLTFTVFMTLVLGSALISVSQPIWIAVVAKL
jgi:hypothetical protein